MGHRPLMRVILDTNVIVSAMVTPDGVPSQILKHWFRREFDLLVQERLFLEIREVTRRPHIRKLISRPSAGYIVNQLANEAIKLDKIGDVDRSADRNDNFLLALAEAGQADFLVSGDKPGLLALKSHGRTQIVPPRAFLDRLRH